MSISHYKVNLLTLEHFPRLFNIPEIVNLIKIWRKKTTFSQTCDQCKKRFTFQPHNFEICCQSFYFTPTKEYVVKAIAVRTETYHFLPVYLRVKMERSDIRVCQDFLVLPDPLYWQISTTLIYETVFNFLLHSDVNRQPSTQPRKKRGSFRAGFPEYDEKLTKYYKKIQDAPLYHCSLSHRTQGKESQYRKIAIAKRAEMTARAMIIPDPDLAPNEVSLPEYMVDALNCYGKWILLNRMPSISENAVIALKNTKKNKSNCVGLPAEVLQSLNADFDGDEVNVYKLKSAEAQIECLFLLNSENNMKSFKNDLKLFPSQDMLVAFYLAPPHVPTQKLTDFFRLVYDLEGSQSCFNWFNHFRLYYLDVLQNRYVFAITLEEILFLESLAVGKSFEEFETVLENTPHREGCLEVQVRSGSKGSLYHIYQLVGSVGPQKLDSGFENIRSSFLSGLTPQEYISHAKSGHMFLIASATEVWIPGYNYSKLVTSTQGLMVDYMGRLVDGETIVSDDALSETFYEDLIGKETFKFLCHEYFPDE